MLIAELDRDGHGQMLPQARELLRVLRKIQATAETHLAREMARTASGKAE